jgi:D-alanine-D-alanine ligase
MSKLSVCILFGGVSSEHSVSEVSASAVINNIDREKYDIHLIGITEEGKWLYYEGITDEI